MADYLAIDWEPHQLSVVEVDGAKSKLKVRNAACFQWPETLNDDSSAAEIGAWLKDQLQAAGLSTRQVVLSVPRQMLVVRQLDVPNVPDEELPDLVRLQAATKSTVSLDQVQIDFVPLPADIDADARHVLMATLPRDRFRRMTGALASAGLQVQSIGVSSLATAELVSRAEEAGAMQPASLTLIISQHAERLELTLTHGRHVVFSHSTQLQGNSLDAESRSVLAEINRALISLQRLMHDAAIARVWMVTDVESDELKAALEQRFNCDVHELDPLASKIVSGSGLELPQGHSAFSGPIGLVFAAIESNVPQIDLLSPRKRPEVQDNRRVKILAGVGLAVILFAGVYSWRSWKMQDLESDIETATSDAEQIAKLNKAKEPVLDSVQELENWGRGDFDWLASMATLNQSLKSVNAEGSSGEVSSDSHQVYVSELHLADATGAALAKVRGTGFARTGTVVDELRRELREQDVSVYPSQTKWDRSDPAYVRQFPLEFDAGQRPETKQRSRSRRTSGRR